MTDPSIHNGAVTQEEIAEMNWAVEFQPLNHPIKTGISKDAESVMDLKTGKVIAKVEPGYKWYWFHSHLHIRPADYENDAEKQEALRLEGGKPGKMKDPAVWLGQAIGAMEKAMGYTEEPERRKRFKEYRDALNQELTQMNSGAIGVALFMQKFFANAKL